MHFYVWFFISLWRYVNWITCSFLFNSSTYRSIATLSYLRSTVAPAKNWPLSRLVGRTLFSSPKSSSVSLSPSWFGGKTTNLHLEMKSSLSDKSSSEDTSKFSYCSRASWTFINFLAAVLYSYNVQTREFAYDAKVKK